MRSLAFAMYKPKEGKSEELKDLLKGHIPTLRKYEFITDKSSYLAESENGTIIEVFEWVSDETKRMAHSHESIREIWKQMMEICEFPKMVDLPEAVNSFPNFRMLEVE